MHLYNKGKLMFRPAWAVQFETFNESWSVDSIKFKTFCLKRLSQGGKVVNQNWSQIDFPFGLMFNEQRAIFFQSGWCLAKSVLMWTIIFMALLFSFKRQHRIKASTLGV